MEIKKRIYGVHMEEEEEEEENQVKDFLLRI